MNEVREARGLTFVHPFDDPVVLAGAGTAGLEIVEDLPEANVVANYAAGADLLYCRARMLQPRRPGQLK